MSWLRSLMLLTCAFAVSCATSLGADKAKVLLIGKKPDHPYGSHMYMHTCEMLAKCLQLTPDVETVVSNGWPGDAEKLKGITAIVIYTRPAAEFLLDGPHRDQVDKLIQSGVGLMTIHWASSVYKKNLDRLGPRWLSYTGGTWVSNVGLSGGTSVLKQLQPGHPICRGWGEFKITDEYYLNPVLDKAQPLLQVTEKMGKEVVVGWAFERPDGGRSFSTTLGHPYKNFQDDRFRRMVVNAILWTAKIDIPKDGAPIDIDEKSLALPPKQKSGN